MKDISKDIQERISSLGNPERAKWLENYVKHGIRSKGVGIPELRQIVLEAEKENALTERGITRQTELLNDLMSREYTEYKLAAILYLQLFWKGKNEKQTLDIVSNWFDHKYITDWNVCDWLCVRVLSPMIDLSAEETIAVLKLWNMDANPWKARASLVPFAQCKSIAQHEKIILEFSIRLIKRDERFCKTAVGWVLREYSKIDKDFVAKFLTAFEKWTTSEVIRNATKYFIDTAKGASPA